MLVEGPAQIARTGAIGGDGELDVAARLREVPGSAAVRGLFFNMVRDELTRRGLAERARRLLGPTRRIYALYPVNEFLSTYAEASALIGPTPREGARAIFGGGSRYFAASWFGRAFRHFLRPDPAAALQWIERSREHLCNYGEWRVEMLAPNHLVLHMIDEYIWIDTAHRGGCEGLLEACGVDGEVISSLDTPYRGRLEIRWSFRN